MKDLIVLCAVVIILLIFPLQYALEQQTHYNISMMQKYVHTAKEQAKQIGEFNNDIKKELIDNLKEQFKIEDSEIIINTSTTKKYRPSYDSFTTESIITYEVGVPIKKIIVANKFWGIPDSDNQYIYYIKGSTTSELISP